MLTIQLEEKLKGLLPAFEVIQRDISQTSTLFKKRLEEYTIRNERYQKATKKLGWREKYFDGFLGGDKASLQNLEREFVELTSFRKSLLDLEKKIKSLDGSFVSEITRFLSKESSEYSSYESTLQLHYEMAKTSAHFYNSLVEAKKKISDALLFTSWNSLLNHSKASVLLQEFYNQVTAYNQKIEEYQSLIKCDLLNGKLHEAIELKTQASAMWSLNGLLTKSNEVLNYANDQIALTDKKRKQLVDEIKSWVQQQYELH